MKQVVQLDENSIFAGVAFADESPLEEGVYLMPAGTVDAEVPETPEGHLARWNNGWVFDAIPEPEAPPSEPDPTPEQVKAEAQRRITAIAPEWKQRNLIAQAAILAEKGRANWTAEELAAWDAGSLVWVSIVATRTVSDVIEAMDPIPADFDDDTHWPASG